MIEKLKQMSTEEAKVREVCSVLDREPLMVIPGCKEILVATVLAILENRKEINWNGAESKTGKKQCAKSIVDKENCRGKLSIIVKRTKKR